VTKVVNLPPSSKDVGVKCLAAFSSTILPTIVLPV
jgi:hypothetical protein